MIHVVVFVKSIIVNPFIADTLGKSTITKFLLFPFFFAGIFHFLAFPAFFTLFPSFFLLFFLLFVPDGFLCPTSGTSHEGPEVPCPSSVFLTTVSWPCYHELEKI